MPGIAVRIRFASANPNRPSGARHGGGVISNQVPPSPAAVALALIGVLGAVVVAIVDGATTLTAYAAAVTAVTGLVAIVSGRTTGAGGEPPPEQLPPGRPWG